MEWKEITTKSTSDLHRLLAETRDHLRDLRFKDAAKQLKSVRQIRDTKKTIAQILTKLHVINTTEAPVEKQQ
ncbi:MAG: 50S ribosomal protein L29 [Candidatus Falkowbacteria bacterium]